MLSNRFSRPLGLALVVSACSLLLQKTEAAVIEYSGSFSLTFDSGAPDYQGVPSLSGTWSLLFDNSVVTGDTNTTFINAPLATISLDTVVGSTTFTTVNTAANLEFVDGALFFITIGGIAAGDASVISFSQDDWMVSYRGTGVPDYAYLSTTSGFLMQQGTITDGGFTAVPEPRTSLIALGLIPALAFLRKRSRA